jgi:hypothetical protein
MKTNKYILEFTDDEIYVLLLTLRYEIKYKERLQRWMKRVHDAEEEVFGEPRKWSNLRKLVDDRILKSIKNKIILQTREKIVLPQELLIFDDEK